MYNYSHYNYITYPGKLCAPFRVVHMVRYCHAITSFKHSDFLCMYCNCMQAQTQHAQLKHHRVL